ncbi:alkaline phosphatase [Tropicimonas marinistellae]|uniref:alkaline phosphatase n=1 Tax=Tropicimonas marinistellae TaxID=1739787 RepID=UPI00082D6609|nr:alkaline phosphatase [Tropicimonas marinistellae]
MKTITTLSLLGAFASTTAMAQDLPQADNTWFIAAQETIAARVNVQPNTSKAKNVILLIADGNGVGTNYITRLFAGQAAGNYGDEHLLPQDTFPHVALSKTYNTNAQTPDSAGTGTAFHTGVKTKQGVLGVDETLARGDCAGVDAATVANASEIFSALGKQVGIISSARLTHATPASAYAHSADRNFESNDGLSEGCEQKDIAAQLVDAMAAGTVDYAFGGGRRHFIPSDLEDEQGKTGKRTDGTNLIEAAAEAGIQYAWDVDTLAGADLSKPVLGLFTSSHMSYEADRPASEPSLSDLTETAIKALEGSENGYFLTIESGRVDHASHATNAYRTVTDGVEFAEAIAIADALTNDEDTLIIVSADHEHAVAMAGYSGRGAPILGLSMKVDGAGEKYLEEPNLAQDGKPYTTVSFLNGASSVMKEDAQWNGTRNAELTQEMAMDMDYTQEVLVPLSSETHSGEDVAIYAKGPWAHLIGGTMEQNVIFHVMHHAATAE